MWAYLPSGEPSSKQCLNCTSTCLRQALRKIYSTQRWPSGFRRDECEATLFTRDQQATQKLIRQSSEDTARRWHYRTSEKLRKAGFGQRLHYIERIVRIMQGVPRADQFCCDGTQVERPMTEARVSSHIVEGKPIQPIEGSSIVHLIFVKHPEAPPYAPQYCQGCRLSFRG